MPRFDLAWALIRITAGFSMFFFHGWGKVVDGGVNNLVGTVARLGFPAPTFFAWCAALAEFVGGILLALGLATRWSALAIGTTMVVALYRHQTDPIARFELPALYLVIMIAAFLIGGGRYSLDSRLRLRFPLEPKS